MEKAWKEPTRNPQNKNASQVSSMATTMPFNAETESHYVSYFHKATVTKQQKNLSSKVRHIYLIFPFKKLFIPHYSECCTILNSNPT